MISNKVMTALLLLLTVIVNPTITAWAIQPPNKDSSTPSISMEPSESFKDDPMLSNWLEFVPKKQEAGIHAAGVRFSNAMRNYEVGYLVGWFERLAEQEEKEKQSNLTTSLEDCDAFSMLRGDPMASCKLSRKEGA